jgi:hypothetical protein
MKPTPILSELRSGRGTIGAAGGGGAGTSRSISSPPLAFGEGSPSSSKLGEDWLSYTLDPCQRSLMLTPIRMLRQPRQRLNFLNIRVPA